MGKTRNARILQWDKQPEGMAEPRGLLSFLRVAYFIEESVAMRVLVV